ncbi:putative pectate lyase 12 [Prunus yedoensis var. nudiflora]|uniref:Putative pectate lyase 12 n=1 Tax=Prunus yedoensis var. nudiflora TaxID=2094558 RepID=A0A314V1H5_PRUYE|nr:putative pectate lyase 12 [Prunus yedoensis var. nudiflora]
MAADCLCLNKGLPLPLLLLWDRASVYVQKLRQHRMLTDFEGATRKNEVGFRIWTSKEFHQYQVVGRKLPTASDEHPKIYRMKLWATNEYFLRKLKKVKKSNGQVLAINEEGLCFFGKKANAARNPKIPGLFMPNRNPIDDCWECDSNWPNNRQSLADCAIGFGQYALGGKGGEYYIVTDSSNDDAVNPRPNTLRYAVIQTEPLWIVFPGNMLIKLSQELIFNSYKTLDRCGANVHIVGSGCITLQFISNVIIHNVHIRHCYPSGDANVRSSPPHYGYGTKLDGF